MTLSTDEFPHDNRRRDADPDPIAIITLCFAAVGMISGVAATIINLGEARRRGREEARTEREAIGDFMIAIDQLTMSGRQLVSAINALERDSRIALSFPSTHAGGRERLQSRKKTFAFGRHVVTVDGPSREMWNLLVDDVCANVKVMNRFVLEYSERLMQLFEATRRFQSREFRLCSG